MLESMTQQHTVSEEVPYDALAEEMRQMQQFMEGQNQPDAVAGGNDPVETAPRPAADTPPEEEAADGEAEDMLGDDEEADGEEAEDLDAEETPPEPTAAEVETPAAAEPQEDPREIEFHAREVELIQREARIAAEVRQQEQANRKAGLDQAQAQLIEELKSDAYGLDEANARRTAQLIRDAVDQANAAKEEAVTEREYFEMAVRTSYVLGQQYGVDPKILLPPGERVTFAEMKAKAEQLGRVKQLERENERLKQGTVPKQTFATTKGGTSRRSEEHLIDSAMTKPEWERTPAEKAALKKAATGVG